MAEEKILQEIRQVAEALCRAELPFLVAGGLALSLHGIPRATIDLDLLVPAQTDVLDKLLMVTSSCGLSLSEEGIERLFSQPSLIIGQWLTFRDQENRNLLDVLVEKSDFFQDLLSRAVRVKLGSSVLRVVSLLDLRRMKVVSGRPLDLADVTLIDERLSLEEKKSEQP
ncbi:MAG TPA: hypothetical protein PKX93_06115 [bacterium]|nr:hypothetical protein [bacterium]HOL67014.1 hypothetical protein [bacterium]HPP13432.1 hypothetical protein [bacterium]